MFWWTGAPKRKVSDLGNDKKRKEKKSRVLRKGLDNRHNHVDLAPRGSPMF